MNKFSAILLVACAVCAVAEPPSGYSYRPRQSFGGHGGGSSHGSSFSSFGGGGHSSSGFSSGGYSSGGYSGGHGGGFGGGSTGYQQVSVGHQTSEGAHLDQQLLHTIKEILIQQENQGGHGSFGGSGGHGSHGISSSYGPPSTSYGPPASFSSGRVVGIDFGHVQQGHQVAQYLKHEASAGHGYAPSFSSFSRPSSSYGAPSFSAPTSFYSAPSRPSSSYGVPH